MTWKIKEIFKDYKAINMNLPYGMLLPHQIKNLSDEIKAKYFTNTSKSKKKKKKVEEEDDLDFIGGHNE